MKSIIITFLVFLMLLPGSFSKKDLKRITKVIREIWPATVIYIKPLELKNTDIDLYQLTDSITEKGFLLLNSAKGRYDYFDYFIITDTALTVLKVKILHYRSLYGGEIANKRWLKQFEGITPNDQLEYSKNIDALSGASISAPSLVNSIQKDMLILNNLVN